MNGTIHLQTASILNISFQNYEKDFTFIINGKKFQTSRLVADILSSKISKMHFDDPTFNEFTINIPEDGDFSNVLDLINFKVINIPKSESLFIFKILQILETKSIDICLQDQEIEITMDNVLDLIHKHEQIEWYYSNNLNNEIDFISEHFSEIEEKRIEALEKLSLNTLSRILENSNLHLQNEGQLLNIVNTLYKIDRKYSVLYEYIVFSNVDINEIDEFLQIFDINDITIETWQSLSKLLKQRASKEHKPSKNLQRYNKKSKVKIPIPYEENKEFNGIINYLRNKSNGKVTNKINITASSVLNECFSPCNILAYDDKSKYFLSENKPNAFVCFDFKKKRVIPTNYTIRSAPYDGGAHPSSWVIEASIDNENWDVIDKQENCSFLNGQSFVHTFKIQNDNNKEFQYIRMRQTGQSFAINNYLRIESFELYGFLL